MSEPTSISQAAKLSKQGAKDARQNENRDQCQQQTSSIKHHELRQSLGQVIESLEYLSSSLLCMAQSCQAPQNNTLSEHSSDNANLTLSPIALLGLRHIIDNIRWQTEDNYAKYCAQQPQYRVPTD